jgi:3',5'-cyclic AMP phosphodiesterase CpdA
MDPIPRLEAVLQGVRSWGSRGSSLLTRSSRSGPRRLPRLRWLDEELAAAPEAPTLLALHHTPLTTVEAVLL